MSNEVSTLSELRREIDHIDDTIHGLLMRRTEIVKKIGAAKTDGIYLNPAREAQVLRRLISRHGGPFPKTVITRLWREIFGALVGLQGPFALAVYMPKRGAGYLELARDQYGAYTPATSYTSVGQVIWAVTDGSATIGVLPMPQEDETSPWWHILASDNAENPKIVARLPFVGPGPGRGDGIEAVAVARMMPEPSGHDNTFLLLETFDGVSRVTVRRLIGEAGLNNTTYKGFHAVGNRVHFHLLEAPGFIARGNERLQTLCRLEGGLVTRTVVLGGYAVPFSAAELAGS
ncbi:MAG: chorismate mutase [Rhodospirillaceae bacterium]|nr:MAG: chorismate mutase [Rhodospirillaceae bacterium]